MRRRLARDFPTLTTVALLAIAGASCAFVGGPSASPARESAAAEQRTEPPPKPKPPVRLVASDSPGRAVLRAAAQAKVPRILVSTRDRWLWYIVGQDTVLSVPVAVGKSENFTYNGKVYRFETPVGRRRVLKKETSPVWTVPEWHYMEKASSRQLELVRLTATSRVKLSDSTFLQVKGQDVGRVNQFGNFWAFTPGTEIVFDGKIFMPPVTTRQRRVPDALGPFKLDTGNGYLIHGTHLYNSESIGQAVSHGCVRMDNTDLERLFHMVDTGTPVFIF